MPASPIGAEGAITVVTPRVRGRPLPLSHPFFLELLASIGEAARDRGCDFTVSHLTPANYEDLVHATTTGRANGVIFLGQGVLHEELNRLAETESRFVVWGAQIPGQKYCTVGTDNLLGGRRATQHLLKLGRKRILFLGGSDPEATQRRWTRCSGARCRSTGSSRPATSSRSARFVPCTARGSTCRATSPSWATTIICSAGSAPRL
jgi:DNA-binding LacI/PurR family transcriptional regulator